MTIFSFILIRRDSVKNLIARAINLFSAQNVMLGYASQDLLIVLYFLYTSVYVDGQY